MLKIIFTNLKNWGSFAELLSKIDNVFYCYSSLLMKAAIQIMKWSIILSLCQPVYISFLAVYSFSKRQQFEDAGEESFFKLLKVFPQELVHYAEYRKIGWSKKMSRP